MHGVAAVSRGPGRIDLFWVDETRSLWHRGFRDGAWADPESLGGTLASPPAVTVWGDKEMIFFAVMPDGELWDRYWDGEAWHPWESLGGELEASATPAASSWGPERLDVFARGVDGTIWHRWWDGARWVDWERLSADSPE